MRVPFLIAAVLATAAVVGFPDVATRPPRTVSQRDDRQPPADPTGLAGSSIESLIHLPMTQHGWYYDHSVTFAVIGDYGRCAVGGPGDCEPAARVAEMVKSWAPQFIVTTGDNNYPLGEVETWATNVAPYREYIPDRFEPAVGNHDYLCDTCPDVPFRSHFGRSLTRDFAKPDQTNPLLRFFLFDSNEADRDGNTQAKKRASKGNPLAAQRPWLQHGLQHMRACWKLVVMHHPPYSSTVEPGSNDLVGPSSGWNYQRWGADVVLSGHAHNYERIMGANSFAYIVNGVGGGPLTGFAAPSVAGSEVRIADAYGAILGHADATELMLELYTIDVASPGAAPRLRDTFSVRRDCNALLNGPR